MLQVVSRICISSAIFFFLMLRPPPRSTLTAPLFPYTTLFLSRWQRGGEHVGPAGEAQHLELVVVGDAEAADSADRLGEGADDEIHLVLDTRSEEHTSELQSLMRISYAVFC